MIPHGIDMFFLGTLVWKESQILARNSAILPLPTEVTVEMYGYTHEACMSGK